MPLFQVFKMFQSFSSTFDGLKWPWVGAVLSALNQLGRANEEIGSYQPEVSCARLQKRPAFGHDEQTAEAAAGSAYRSDSTALDMLVS